ncbi:MAG: substrate-binding domain-containing protein [Porticoccus sp.]|nr:substrate-binding domain-containing protein [Porticoccus sp.]
MEVPKIKTLVQHVSLAAMGGALLLGSGATFAHGGQDKSYTLQGTCAFLPAARATEFHGNPDRSKLNLGMAGNQWVVFEAAMQAFNLSQGYDPMQPAYRPNDADGFTLADLRDDKANRYYVQLIPPGQIKKQIMTGCMTLGNDEDRNFLPGNVQVDFDVFASTNYDLMQELADKGFIDEAVPYIRNRLDLMVADGNPKGIGTGFGAIAYGSDGVAYDPAFDVQFDIIMDLMSGDVVASSLDHINEGIHNASNGYMKKVHGYVRSHNREVRIPYYKDADGNEYIDETRTAKDWVQVALAPVATPMPGSPSALRLVSRDSGEKHDAATGHDMATFEDNKGAGACWKAGALGFCEMAVLNKANTHESRVHHVETPNGVIAAAPGNGYAKVDVGYVWITELAYQINAGNTAVTGMNGVDLATLGIPNTASVNADKIYSLALLATSDNEKKGRQFIDFLRSTEGQAAYVAGGFTGMIDQTDLDAGVCYARPVGGAASVATPRNGDGSCDDWLGNN